MSTAWIIGLLALGVIFLIVIRRGPKKVAPKSELQAFAESMGHSVFPNGKADHDEGARMVHEIVGGTMTMDECRALFVKAAIMAGMGGDLSGHLERNYGNRLTELQLKTISGYIVLRILAMASGPGTVMRRHDDGTITYGPE